MDALPIWARKFLKEKDALRVTDAVRAAEAATQGEYVVVLVRGSSGTGHAPALCALVLFCLLITADLSSFTLGSFSSRYLGWIIEAVVAGVAGHFLARLDAVRRLCVPPADRQLLVDRRARLEFYKNHLEKTRGATGILLFMSLLERQAVVLADKSIAKKVPAQEWDDVVKRMVAGIKTGNLGGGLADAVGRCAQIVEPHFPRKGSKKNELADHLIVKD